MLGFSLSALCSASLMVAVIAQYNPPPTDCNTCAAMSEGLAVTFCGTDKLTHTAHSEAFDERCFDKCGLMVYHQGSCGCPNDCNSASGQGRCSTSNTCACSAHWTGADCSLPSTGNSCNYHGQLVQPTDKGAVFSFPYCKCDDGWTGSDCSSPVLNVGNLPWGSLYDNQVYTSADKYGDQHPVWNISVLATIRVELDEADYINLLQPWNLYNESYAQAKLYFDNGNVQKSFDSVGFRIKGATSRMDQKKGWAIKFNEFVSGQALLDIKKMGLKPGSVSDDTLLKTMLYTDFSRAMAVPVQRASYTLLYINNMFAGIYFLHEEIGPTFFDTRLPNDNGSGNTYKMFYNVNLGYFGSDDTYYKNKVHVNEIGVPMNYYEQTDGNGDWSDLIDFLYFFNSTSDDVFLKNVESRVDVNSLLREFVVESFMLSSDNYESGQNYYVYHRQDKNYAQQLMIVEYDFDECFYFDPITGEADKNTDIFSYYVCLDCKFEDRNPVSIRLLTTPKYSSIYLNNYQHFLESVFGSSSAQQPSARYAAMMQFILPWVEKDLLWQIDMGVTPDQFVLDAERTIKHLTMRFEDTYAQVRNYLGN